MAPKRRGGKVVSSVVKRTKVVKETLQVATTTILPDSLSLPDPEVVDVQRSTDVRVEVVTTPEPPTSAKKAKKGGRQDASSPKSPVQSQETQEAADPFGRLRGPARRDKTAPAGKKTEEKAKPAPEGPETPRQKKPKGGRSPRLESAKRRGGGSRPEMGYKRFVYWVLKQVHPELGASGKTMEILDMMMADMFERLPEKAAWLTKHAGRETLTSREVQSAVRLVLPGELAVHAISEGTKAVTNYMSQG